MRTNVKLDIVLLKSNKIALNTCNFVSVEKMDKAEMIAVTNYFVNKGCKESEIPK